MHAPAAQVTSLPTLIQARVVESDGGSSGASHLTPDWMPRRIPRLLKEALN